MTAAPEEWRPVLGYEGLYEVSSLGRVRSVERVVLTRRRNGIVPTRRRSIILRAIAPIGYPVVALHRQDRGRPAHVHTLVCEAFHGPRPAGMQVAHNDGSRDNNQPNNLRWATPSENNLDKKTHGTQQDQRGEKAPGAKLTNDKVAAIRKALDEIPQKEIARSFGVAPSTISNIRTGKRWSHQVGA